MWLDPQSQIAVAVAVIMAAAGCRGADGSGGSTPDATLVTSFAAHPRPNGFQLLWQDRCGVPEPSDPDARSPRGPLRFRAQATGGSIAWEAVLEVSQRTSWIPVAGLTNGVDYLVTVAVPDAGEPFARRTVRPGRGPVVTTVRQGGAARPLFSPREDRIAILDPVSGQWSILDLEDESELFLGAWAEHVLWAPSGEQLFLFAGPGSGTQYRAEVIDASTGDVLRTGEINTPSAVRPFHFDGISVHLTSGSEWLTASGPEFTVEQESSLGYDLKEWNRELDPRLSRDGSLIAYPVMNRHLGPDTVHVERSDTGALVGEFRHPNPVRLLTPIAWNSSGTHIAAGFAARETCRSWAEVWVLDITTGDWTQLTGYWDQGAVSVEDTVTWAPDNTSLAVSDLATVQLVSNPATQ